MTPPARLDDAGVVDLADALLSLHSVGLVFTDILESQVGANYRSNSPIMCLAVVCEQGPIRLRDLAPEISLSGPAASRVVDRLVDAGDVVRRADHADDRRAVTMSATRTGRRRLDRIERALVDASAEIGVPLKDTLLHLDRIQHVVSEPSSDDAAATTIVSLVGRLARIGTMLGAHLRSASPSGDVAEALALFALARSGESRPRSISESVGLTSGGTTKLLDRLEADGLVERRFGLSDDRRGVSITLTPSGRRRLVDVAETVAPLLVAERSSLAEVNDHLDRSRFRPADQAPSVSSSSRIG